MSLPPLKAFLLTAICILAPSSPVKAQQPFFTDDADTAPKGTFKLKVINQFDILQRSAFPGLKQNTASFTLNYGLSDRVEIGINSPLVTLINARGTSPRTASGAGDTSLSVKYNFHKVRAGSRIPALTVSFDLELPTGDRGRRLDSTLIDYDLNGIIQTPLDELTVFRINCGVLFSGKTLTGVAGGRTRGTVLESGASLVRQFTQSLDLGVEVVGAIARNPDLGKTQLQFQVGGNYAMGESFSLDFGVIAGRFAASPRLGFQLGFSLEF